MKIKTTRKAVVNSADTIISACYCELQFLLSNHSPIAYTSGIYGWDFDVYSVYGVTICTGYRNMPGTRRTNTREFEQKAREVHANRNMSYEDRCKEIEKLLKTFLFDEVPA